MPHGGGAWWDFGYQVFKGIKSPLHAVDVKMLSQLSQVMKELKVP